MRRKTGVGNFYTNSEHLTWFLYELCECLMCNNRAAIYDYDFLFPVADLLIREMLVTPSLLLDGFYMKSI